MTEHEHAPLNAQGQQSASKPAANPAPKATETEPAAKPAAGKSAAKPAAGKSAAKPAVTKPLTNKPLVLFPAPQIFSSNTTQRIMLTVVIALLPALVAATIQFGPRAVLVVAVAVASAVLFEYLWCRLRKTQNTVGDLSAVVTGMLLAYNVPSTLPLPLVVLGSFVAIIIVKELFGGIGHNFANPAIVARIVLSVSFPAAMTTYLAPGAWSTHGAWNTGIDTLSAATQLAPSAEPTSIMNLFLGAQAGVLGETSALAILMGLAVLLVTRTITWHVPVVYVGVVFLFSMLAGKDPVMQIFSGGLLLGAVFMATDYTTSPVTAKGKIIFALGLAVITCLIRFWGNMNEGVAYAILFMNLLVPYIDSATADVPVGVKRTSRFSFAKRKEVGHD